MPRLTDSQIAAAVKSAGFPESAWVTAIAVALAESGGNSDATNSNSNRSTDYGLFQINSVHSDLLNGANWRDPVENARMALAVSSNGTNWKPWVAYTTGRHLPFLARARKAAGNPTGGTGITVAPVGLNPLGGDFWSTLTRKETWLRVGYFVVGGLLILIALANLTNATSLIPAGRIVKGAKALKAAK